MIGGERDVFDKGSVILFQGDSITDGGRSRNEDWNHVLGHGYAYMIAARLGADRPDKSFRFYNRGCSGHRVVDLYARWQEDTLNLKPDVISILVGVNDVGHGIWGNAGVSAERYEKVYQLMLEETVAALPKARLVLCEPFILPVGGVKDRWNDWKAEIDKNRRTVALLARQFGAVHVPFQRVMDDACSKAGPEYWLWDGVHPMPAGHELMARAWLSAISGGTRTKERSDDQP